ncbi:unnamed protein product, partial [Oikopleura dioica]
MIEEFAPAALIGFVLSGLVIFLGLSQGPRRKPLATGLSSTPFEIRDRASVTPRLPTLFLCRDKDWPLYHADRRVLSTLNSAQFLFYLKISIKSHYYHESIFQKSFVFLVTRS